MWLFKKNEARCNRKYVCISAFKKSDKVFGGSQIRPNIHIQDLINIYLHFINNPNIKSGCYNAGFENLKLIDIAKTVSKLIPSK